MLFSCNDHQNCSFCRPWFEAEIDLILVKKRCFSPKISCFCYIFALKTSVGTRKHLGSGLQHPTSSQIIFNYENFTIFTILLILGDFSMNLAKNSAKFNNKYLFFGIAEFKKFWQSLSKHHYTTFCAFAAWCSSRAFFNFHLPLWHNSKI